MAEVPASAKKEDLVNRIREFIVNNFLLGEDDGSLNIDSSLLEQGVIDSTGVIELVSFVEDDLEVEVPDSDVVPAHFGSISALADYVLKQQQ